MLYLDFIEVIVSVEGFLWLMNAQFWSEWCWRNINWFLDILLKFTFFFKLWWHCLFWKKIINLWIFYIDFDFLNCYLVCTGCLGCTLTLCHLKILLFDTIYEHCVQYFKYHACCNWPSFFEAVSSRWCRLRTLLSHDFKWTWTQKGPQLDKRWYVVLFFLKANCDPDDNPVYL